MGNSPTASRWSHKYMYNVDYLTEREVMPCRCNPEILCKYCWKFVISPASLQWRQNERDGVSNHRHLDCLFNRLFRHSSKKILRLRVTCLWAGNLPATGEFPTQRASNRKCFHLMTSSCDLRRSNNGCTLKWSYNHHAVGHLHSLHQHFRDIVREGTYPVKNS